jgi:Phosphoesterase family
MSPYTRINWSPNETLRRGRTLKAVTKYSRKAARSARTVGDSVPHRTASGGYYDSGFIQPVDFFGTGPRIPMMAVSPFSTGGHVTHVYNEHSSFVKFVERNWGLGKLTSRSRDNLPNPKRNRFNPYVPANMPAIGDLFDMFDFGHDFDDDDRDDKGDDK